MDEKKDKNAQDRAYMMLAFRIVADFGAIIAIPVVVFVLIGQQIDHKRGGGYWATGAAFVLAALVTGYLIWTKAKQFGKEFDDIEK